MTCEQAAIHSNLVEKAERLDAAIAALREVQAEEIEWRQLAEQYGWGLLSPSPKQELVEEILKIAEGE